MPTDIYVFGMLKIGALISEGNDLGKAVPVVYVSGEEVRFHILSLSPLIHFAAMPVYLQYFLSNLLLYVHLWIPTPVLNFRL